MNSFTTHLLSKLNSWTTEYINGQWWCDNTIGYYPTKGKIYITEHLPTIQHEIAHMVELKNMNRLLEIDFGFKMFEGKNATKNEWIAASAREIRTRTIDRLIEKSPCVKEPGLNSYWRELLHSRMPLGRFKTTKELIEWEQKLVEQTLKNWNVDRIETV